MQAAFWICGLVFCLFILQFTHDKKWPVSRDLYKEAERATKWVKPRLKADSVLNIRVEKSLPEDFYLYLRYCLIPQRAQLSLRQPEGKELLVGSKKKIDSLLAATLAYRPAVVLSHYEDRATGYYLIQY